MRQVLLCKWCHSGGPQASSLSTPAPPHPSPITASQWVGPPKPDA